MLASASTTNASAIARTHAPRLLTKIRSAATAAATPASAGGRAAPSSLPTRSASATATAREGGGLRPVRSHYSTAPSTPAPIASADESKAWTG